MLKFVISMHDNLHIELDLLCENNLLDFMELIETGLSSRQLDSLTSTLFLFSVALGNKDFLTSLWKQFEFW